MLIIEPVENRIGAHIHLFEISHPIAVIKESRTNNLFVVTLKRVLGLGLCLIKWNDLAFIYLKLRI